MKNLWIQTEHAFATWTADFTEVNKRPEAILEFVQAAVNAGVRHRVADVVEAQTIDYRRDRDGALADVLARRFHRDRILDLFGFTGSAMLPGLPRSSTTETRLSYFDAHDRVVDDTVTDLGAVLEALEPAPGVIPNGFKTHYPAVRLTGWRYEQIGRSVPRGRLPIAAFFAIHSDIWFPWVFGSAHPWTDHRRMFDNRELANRHTPRLNAFLAEVAEAARRVGGSFGVYDDETSGRARAWVDDQGVRLDWMPPDGVMPPEALGATWE
jgi:hypothetical protein